MKHLHLTLLFASFFTVAYSQNNALVIDLSKPDITGKNVDITKKLQLSFSNCQTIKSVNVALFYKGDQKPMSINCGGSGTIDLPGIMGQKPDQSLTVTLIQPNSGPKDSIKTLFKFSIKTDGTLITSQGDATPQATEVLPEDTHVYVDATYLVQSVGNSPSDCAYPRIVYNPCCNKVTIYKAADKDTHYLRYYSKSWKNNGVVFMINDFNTLKYSISLTSTFTNNNTTTPALFNTVYSLLQTSAAQLADSKGGVPDPTLEAVKHELSRINKLNKSLKQYFLKLQNTPDCGGFTDFETQRAAVLNNIQTELDPGKTGNGIAGAYNKAKQDYIAKQQVATATYDQKQYNQDIQKHYNLPITPDSLLRETQGLVNTLATIVFRFQYNVIKLQNADKLTFNVTITPKTITTGGFGGIPPINTNSSFDVYLRGGWKVDFTSGLYWTNRSNTKYALQPVTDATGTVTSNTIISQPGSGGSALGVDALMHIYPRLGTVQPTFVMGVGSSLDFNYSFLAGGGVVFGKENRFAITGGYSYTSVKVLSAQYQGVSAPVAATAVSTYNRYKPGVFISLSYSLGLFTSSQSAAAPATANPSGATPAAAAATPSPGAGAAGAGKSGSN